MIDVADIFRRHLELRVFVFRHQEPPYTNSCFANHKKNPDIDDLMVFLACQSFIRVFEKAKQLPIGQTNDEIGTMGLRRQLSCTDVITRTQNFDLRILLYSSGCRVPNRLHKVPHLHPLPWPFSVGIDSTGNLTSGSYVKFTPNN